MYHCKKYWNFDPECEYSKHKIPFRAWRATGTFEKQAPGPVYNIQLTLLRLVLSFSTNHILCWHLMACYYNEWHKNFTCQYVEDAVVKTVSMNVDPIIIEIFFILVRMCPSDEINMKAGATWVHCQTNYQSPISWRLDCKGYKYWHTQKT